MRIVGGTLRGRTVHAQRGDRVRPTSDRTRQALFNILDHGLAGFEIDGARVLDLFAGTGALGLEALSRGASFSLFVDDHPQSRALIRRNVEDMGQNGNTKIYRRDATRLGPLPASAGGTFDLVFADPPYGKELGEKALTSARDGGWLSEGAIIVLEESGDAEISVPSGFEEVDRRTYGDTQVFILRRAA